MTRTRGLAVAIGIAAAACHNARSDPPHSLADQVGVYQFTQHVGATGAAAEYIDLVGEVTVFADTVIVDARPGPCRVDETVRSPSLFTYRCGPNVVLTFDRRSPMTGARYSATLAENVSRQVCASYATDATGRRYCAATRTETSQRMARLSGSLTLTRAPGAGGSTGPPR